MKIMNVVIFLMAFLWIAEANAGVTVKFSSSSVSTIGRMHCSIVTDLVDIEFPSIGGASFGINQHYQEDKGSTSVALFDKDGNMVAHDQGGVAPSPGNVVNISEVVAAQYETVRTSRDAGDTIYLAGWPENWPSGSVLLTYSGNGSAEIMLYRDSITHQRLTIFYRCEGSGKVEILVPFSIHY